MKNLYRFFTFNVAFFVLISTFYHNATAEGLYKWVDEHGKVTYQSSPPPDSAADVERSQISIDNPDEPVAEEATERPTVEFYSGAECLPCDDARTYLEGADIPFEEVDVTAGTTEADEMQARLGHTKVPTIIVGDRTITGFNRLIVENILRDAGFDILTEE